MKRLKTKARAIWARAVDALGEDLGGSLLDLLADNLPEPTAQLREVVTGLSDDPWDGTRRDEDSTGWYSWAVFPASVSDAAALYTVGCPRRYYGGPGQSFTREPLLRRTRTRLLVTWRGGLDI